MGILVALVTERPFDVPQKATICARQGHTDTWFLHTGPEGAAGMERHTDDAACLPITASLFRGRRHSVQSDWSAIMLTHILG